MRDNTTAHISDGYDDKILSTISFYNMFHESAVELIKSINIVPNKWLDTGCGTGNLINDASNIFINTMFTLAGPSAKMIEVAKEKI